MKEQSRFFDVSKAHLKTLGVYVPVVDRVHGAHHPEFHEVRRLFDMMADKISKAGKDMPQLTEEFLQLRQVTDSYKVPGDVCESYEAVYKMLAEMDHAYHG